MSKAAFTIKAFAVYLFGLGVLLLLAPDLVLGPFGFPAPKEVWIRVLGVVVINLGAYYWAAAASETRRLFMVTVYTRVFVLAAFTGLALLDFARPALTLFGIVDALGALWTYFALKSDEGRRI